MGNKKSPPPDKSINREPEQEPKISPSTGQHSPDIQDEKLKRKRGNRPLGRDDINPEEYNDGPPVEEKSPRISNIL